MNEELLKQLLGLYFKCNPEPSDEQFHDLARSLGMDPATLESVSYKMNAESEGAEAGTLLAATEAEDVLDGDYDPDTTSPDLLMLNDGEPSAIADDGEQDALRTDGVGPEDVGVDVANDQDVLNTDGAPGLKLQAAARLALTAAPQEVEVAGMPATHLAKKRGTAEQLGAVADQKPNTIIGITISSPKGKQGYFFLGSAAGLKLGTPVRFKGTRGKVDVVAKINEKGKVFSKGRDSLYVLEEVRPFYVFK